VLFCFVFDSPVEIFYNLIDGIMICDPNARDCKNSAKKKENISLNKNACIPTGTSEPPIVAPLRALPRRAWQAKDQTIQCLARETATQPHDDSK
jgi:hypothetical protein